MNAPPKDRFEFGQNWAAFIADLRDDQIQQACRALTGFHGADQIQGKDFLDIGCGSGLHSLAAVAAGAKSVLSMDYDPRSVESCEQLKAAHAPQAPWTIRQGDILSPAEPQGLQTYDIVYSWGVLHHTGSLWKALENTLPLVRPRGHLHIAIYNRHWTSPLWRRIKALYVAAPAFAKNTLLGLYAALDILRMAAHGQNPWRVIRAYKKDRGMRWLINLRDWLGGYPYEYASTDEIIEYVRGRRFALVKLVPNQGTGCSEFLFKNEAS